MTDEITIASVVEGHGEVYALPDLIRRVAGQIFDTWNVRTTNPHRVPRGKMATREIDRATRLQSQRIVDRGGIIVVADADDDCAIELASQVTSCISASRVQVAVAVREYESWFLASIESLRLHRAVRDDAEFTGDPESPRDAKGRLEANMVEAYRETLHQPAFTSLFDIATAQRSRSFRHFTKCIGNLLE